MSEEILKGMPKNIDAEICVLGAIMNDNEYFYKADEVILAEDFYLEKHRELYKIMDKLIKRGVNLDLITVLEDIKNNNLIEKCGGISYVTNIYCDSVQYKNFEDYLKIIKDKANMRKIIQISKKFTLRVFESENIDGDVNEFQSSLSNIFKDKFGKSLVKSHEAVLNSLQEIENCYLREGRLLGISTGFTAIDNCISGIEKGNFTIIAGRPSMGKTSFALNIADNVAKECSTAFFSLEMNTKELVHRMLSASSLVEYKKIRLGNMNDEEFQRIAQASNNLSKRKMYLDDESFKIEDIMAKCRNLRFNEGLDMVFIDYLQCLSTRKRFNSLREEINYISKELKTMAKKLNIAVVALCQLSRAVDSRADHRPILTDLKESGNIEQDADVIMMLYRENYYNKKANPYACEVLVNKNRNGESKKIIMGWRGEFQRFGELKKRIKS